MHPWVTRRMHTSPSWRSRVWFCLLASVALFGLGVDPVSAQSGLLDPGLDSIMKTVPVGFDRAQDDQIPKGPMTAEEFSKIGQSDLPEVENDAVFYGATYEKADGPIMVVFAMSTTHQADGQQFASGVIAGAPTKDALPTGIAGAKGVEGDADGIHAVVIAFARNGRGFAVMAFGESGRDDAVRFAGALAGVAESTPPRSDVKTTDAELSALIGTLTFFALLAIAIVWVVRFVRRKKARTRGAMPAMTTGPSYDMPVNPWGQNTGTGSVERPVHTGFPPPPPPPPQ
jgi:hypothetical protein